jgi:hypothetical protein
MALISYEHQIDLYRPKLLIKVQLHAHYNYILYEIQENGANSSFRQYVKYLNKGIRFRTLENSIWNFRKFFSKSLIINIVQRFQNRLLRNFHLFPGVHQINQEGKQSAITFFKVYNS